MSSVDLNADLGEGFGIWRLGDDDALLPLLTSANIACGFHGGDARTMRRVCAVAAEHGVRIGAQVGYRDLAGFGRRRIDIDPDELSADIVYQIGALRAFADIAATSVRYVKAHGALYNTAMIDPVQAEAVAEAAAAFGLPLLGLADSQLELAAKNRGVAYFYEGFADRAYLPSGQLVSRTYPGAVISDPDEVATRSLAMVTQGQLRAQDGSLLNMRLDSLCVHGDTPGAVALAKKVRAVLENGGVQIRPFL